MQFGSLSLTEARNLPTRGRPSLTDDRETMQEAFERACETLQAERR